VLDAAKKRPFEKKSGTREVAAFVNKRGGGGGRKGRGKSLLFLQKKEKKREKGGRPCSHNFYYVEE